MPDAMDLLRRIIEEPVEGGEPGWFGYGDFGTHCCFCYGAPPPGEGGPAHVIHEQDCSIAAAQRFLEGVNG